MFGIDVHPVYQDDINFELVEQEKYKVVFTKVSEGTSYVPPGVSDYVRRIKSRNFVVGYYHFLDNSDGDRQAAHFCKKVNDLGGKEGAVLVVDFEAYGTKTPSNQDLRDFINGVKKRFGTNTPILLYSGYGFWTSGTPSGDASTYNVQGLWDARYADMERHDAPRVYWSNIRGWWMNQPRWGGTPPPNRVAGQYTSAGLVGGLYVDVDVFFVTKAQFVESFVNGTPTPTPEPTTKALPDYVRNPVEYLEKCKGGKYTPWVSGHFRNGVPAWVANTAPPDPALVRGKGGFCASALNLACRVNRKFIFQDTANWWAGGVAWWGERIKNKNISRPYDPEKNYPAGTLFIRYYTGPALKDQGHVAIQGRHGKLLQSDAFEGVPHPGFNEKRTHRETHRLLIKFDGGGWQRVVLPEDWLK